MLKLLRCANNLRAAAESARFERAARAPRETQESFLRALLGENAATAFGREHRFDRLSTIAAYRRAVPVRDYEALRPYVKRLIDGERAVLTREEPFMFTLTSGTTDEPKYIPVTRGAQKLNSKLMRQWVYRAERAHRAASRHATFAVVSRAVEGRTPGGLPFGSASGTIYQNIPRFIRRAYAVPYETAEIRDYDERYFALARFALAARVSTIATPNPTTLLRLAEIMRENGERLVRAVRDGRLGVALAGQDEIRRKLAAPLAPDPRRARELENLLRLKGFLRPADCWPELRLIGCWLGGSVGARAARLAEFYGRAPLRDLGYLASEGNFTLPIADGAADGVLAVESAFYEFIPEEECEKDAPRTLLADELETGKRYEVLLTTAGGLYRYRINDVVEVAGFYRRTPRLRFVRKAGEAASITGEKMHANHLLQAFAELGRRFALTIEKFCAVPDFEESRYEIYLELKKGVAATELPAALDEALQRINLEYAHKRHSKRLGAPVVYLMRAGWSRAGLRRHILAGRRDTQYKPPVLKPRKDHLDASFVAAVIRPENALARGVAAGLQSSSERRSAPNRATKSSSR